LGRRFFIGAKGPKRVKLMQTKSAILPPYFDVIFLFFQK